ncbi:MAG: N-acetylneuraminate synthase [Candidatus Rifleibacteriota bacterium]
MSGKLFIDSFEKLPIIIAEAGVNHNGDPRLAMKLVEAAAEAGADMIKFQTFKAEECASAYAPAAQYQRKTEISSQLELLRGLELDFAVFARLKKFSEEKGLAFLSTPDGSASLKCLIEIKVDAVKIGSGEVTNLPFLAEIAASRLPVIFSTGMSTIGEVEKAVACLKKNGCTDLTLLHCTSEYPAPANEINLRTMKTMRQAFSLPVGLSDHSTGFEAAIAATALGACIIEKHFTLDRNLPGPDHAASIEPAELKTMVDSVRKTAEMMGSAIKVPSPAEMKNMPLVRRGICAARAIKAGQKIVRQDLACKRPTGDLAPEMLDLIVGRIALRDFQPDQPICWNQLGQVDE